MATKARTRTGTARTGPQVVRAAALRGGQPTQDRELRAQGRKTMRRLLEAGSYVFEQRGFHAARVDDIVNVAKTSHGTFYLYFSNKEDLFKALAHDAMSDMAVLADELGPVTPDSSGREALRAWVARFVDTYAAHGTVIRAWTEGALMDNDLLQEGRELLLRLSTTLAKRIEAAGTVDGRAHAAGVACLSMLERFTYFVQAHQVDFDRDDIVDTLTDGVFSGFFTPRSVARVSRLRRRARA